ncbi:MAG: M48 family metalloprotease [Planctomycetota bacterium]|nr:M48 family metalloprotease [Planctomycetota bacterium]
MLFLGYYGENPIGTPPALIDSLSFLGLRAGVLFLIASLLNRCALALIRRRGAESRRRLAAGVDIGLRLLLLAAYADGLESSALPWSLARALGRDLSQNAFAFQLAGILPFLLLFPCAWLPMFGLHREMSFGNWTRASFLIHKIRYNLFLLLAWLPFAAVADWLSGFLLAIPAVFLLAAWTFPLILARAWGCRRLTDPETLSRLARLETTAGTGFSRAYLWEPGGGYAENAAAVGILRPFRYLFLTPSLLRNMSGPELDAVILHELGHVRHRHLLFYFFSSLAGVNASVVIAAVLPLTGPGERFAAVAILLLIYFRLIFGWLSRNMERQADLFAMQKSGSASGIANALEKLALAAGRIRLAGSWHHWSIAERVRFLRQAENQPALARRHGGKVFLLKLSGYLASIALLILLALTALAGIGTPSLADQRETTVNPEAHWRLVMRLLPDHPVPPLQLAYLLGKRADARPEALRLARSASSLAVDGEGRAAADKLARELAMGAP